MGPSSWKKLPIGASSETCHHPWWLHGLENPLYGLTARCLSASSWQTSPESA